MSFAHARAGAGAVSELKKKARLKNFRFAFPERARGDVLGLAMRQSAWIHRSSLKSLRVWEKERVHWMMTSRWDAAIPRTKALRFPTFVLVGPFAMESKFPLKADGAVLKKEEVEELETAASFIFEVLARAKSLIRLLFVCRV
jgi:hypothetical protein